MKLIQQGGAIQGADRLQELVVELPTEQGAELRDLLRVGKGIETCGKGVPQGVRDESAQAFFARCARA